MCELNIWLLCLSDIPAWLQQLFCCCRHAHELCSAFLRKRTNDHHCLFWRAFALLAQSSTAEVSGRLICKLLMLFATTATVGLCIPPMTMCPGGHECVELSPAHPTSRAPEDSCMKPMSPCTCRRCGSCSRCRPPLRWADLTVKV